ncbi:MAG TPA: ankyrin repeat domain-containing protein [Micropepsaceae bacterium]|nr:ankyrin repeat domain-containing protein [Micropepsaceae bacterium]
MVDAILAAIKANDEAAALAALSHAGKVTRAAFGETPVLAALYRGMARIARELVSHGYEPDLVESAALGDVSAIGAALSRGEDIQGLSADGWTPLHLAAFLGRAEAVAALLQAGARHDAISQNSTRNHPLHAAIAGRTDMGVIAALLAAGADVRFAGGAGYTPLMLAASRGNLALCELLLAKGAVAEARSDDGKSAAMIARERGHEAVAAALESKAG